MFKPSSGRTDDTTMSEPVNETLDAPTQPPSNGSAEADLPSPTPTPLPLVDGELPRLAETAYVTPPAPTV